MQALYFNDRMFRMIYRFPQNRRRGRWSRWTRTATNPCDLPLSTGLSRVFRLQFQAYLSIM